MPVPPYLSRNQSPTALSHTRAKNYVREKPLCRHCLDAATVPRPFILPCFAREYLLPAALLRATIFCTDESEYAIDPHVIPVTKSIGEPQRR